MESKVKISVIVPIYNCEAFLERCVDSILNQTFQEFEIILIDDGSTDKSAEICDTYKQKEERIRVFHQKNGGISVARNLGIDNAFGEYLLFVDADDWIEKNTLEELYNEIKVQNVNVIRYSYFNNKNQTENLYLEESIEKSRVYQLDEIKEILLPKFLSGQLPCYACLFFLKRDFLIENHIKFEAGINMEDKVFCMDILLKLDKIYFDNKKLYHYFLNINGISWSSKRYKDNLMSILALTELLRKRLENEIKFSEYDSILLCSHLELVVQLLTKISKLGQEDFFSIFEYLFHCDIVNKMLKNVKIVSLPKRFVVQGYFLKHNKRKMCFMWCRFLNLFRNVFDFFRLKKYSVQKLDTNKTI